MGLMTDRFIHTLQTYITTHLARVFDDKSSLKFPDYENNALEQREQFMLSELLKYKKFLDTVEENYYELYKRVVDPPSLEQAYDKYVKKEEQQQQYKIEIRDN